MLHDLSVLTAVLIRILIGVCRWVHVAEGRSASVLTDEISVCV